MPNAAPGHSTYHIEHRLNEFIREQSQETRDIQRRLDHILSESRAQTDAAKENNSAANAFYAHAKDILEQTDKNLRDKIRDVLIVVGFVVTAVAGLGALRLSEVRQDLETELSHAKSLKNEISVLLVETQQSAREMLSEAQLEIDGLLANVELKAGDSLARLSEAEAAITSQIAEAETQITSHIADAERNAAAIQQLVTNTQSAATEFLASLDTRDQQLEARVASELQDETRRLDAQALYSESLSHFYAERYEEALSAIDNAILLNDSDVRIWRLKGRILHAMERYDDAFQALDRAIEIDSEDSTNWVTRGFLLNDIERYDEALQALDSAIEINPQSSTAWNNKGFALNGLGRYDEALQALDRAIELDPESSYSWKNRGDTHSRLGNRDQALSHFRRAVEIDPSMAELALEQGLYEEFREDEEFNQIVAEARSAAGE